MYSSNGATVLHLHIEVLHGPSIISFSSTSLDVGAYTISFNGRHDVPLLWIDPLLPSTINALNASMRANEVHGRRLSSSFSSPDSQRHGVGG